MIEIFFGDARTSIIPDQIRGGAFSIAPVQTVIFSHQTHGVTGNVITLDNSEVLGKAFACDGDYLLTNVPAVGLGVLTADCLPIAIHDPVHRACAMIHAGWRGTIGQIVVRALMHMEHVYGTQPEDVVVYFGPCARECCYEVGQEFIDALPIWAQACAKKREQKLFFDVLGCNKAQLERVGVEPKKIDTKRCMCTLCNANFCSHRRNSGALARQMSIIWIK